MKIALISDTHGMLPPLELFEGADLALHAGDIGPDYDVQNWIDKKFRPWLHQLRNEMDIQFWGTLGNHDDPAKWLPNDDLPFIIDDVVMCGHLKVWFSPWSPRFGNWHWMTDEFKLTEIYRQIPVDTDIVVSHSPMFGARDANVGGTLCGSKALRVRMRELRPKFEAKPILVCGHIHEGFGQEENEFSEVFNVASLDEYYQMRKDPITWIEL